MGFSVDISIPTFTVFLQGLVSFLSPCVLPIIPIYVSYFSAGAGKKDEQGNIVYPQGRILLHTIFFVLGISVAFFILGLGVSSLGRFFSGNKMLFAKISGILMILFGLYQLGVFGHIMGVEKERRFIFDLNKLGMSPLTALLLGFTFSFAWSPCIGPVMSSVLLMAGSAQTASKGFLLIGVYVLGFIIPFLLTGAFTGTVLNFFKRHQRVVQYTVKIGGVLMILMGLMTLTGFMNGITGYLSRFTPA